jgi:DNA adenine methylase
MSNVSPLRYPGGKTRACKILNTILEENNINLNEYSYLASPFFGGGSFEFFIGNKFPHLTILANDKFTPLFNFWEKVADQNERSTICQELEKELGKVTKESFVEKRETLTNSNMEYTLERARDYFIINRCSFSGATLSGGFSKESSIKRFTQSSIDRVKSLNLEKLKFTNINFVEFMYTIGTIEENKKYFVFLDPPYFLEKGSKLYGNSGDLHEDFNHEALWLLLISYTSLNIPWMLTYNDCPYIRKLYSLESTNHEKIKIKEVDWKYGMNKSKNSSEIVITSF